MGQVWFNFHDVILWMTAMQCLFFSIILVATNDTRTTGTYFLAAFLFMHAIIPLHELILWGGQFKLVVRAEMPELYFIGATAYFLDGALLLFCIRTLVFKDFSFRYRQLWHALPALLFIVFLIIAFYRLPTPVRLFLIKSERFVYDEGYVYADVIAKSLRVLYGLGCLFVMRQYQQARLNRFSLLSQQDSKWLLVLILGFILVSVMEVSLSGAKVINLTSKVEFDVFVRMGLAGYYISFAMISLWVFTGIRFFSGFQSVVRSEPINNQKNIEQEVPIDPVLTRSIDEGMKNLKPYTNPDLKLDQLAQVLGFAPKELSNIINRHFRVNFYEFVNEYRIQEATDLLRRPEYQSKTITDIYLTAGFNSKSVFNTFFKKKLGMTPSQFRQTSNQTIRIAAAQM